MVMFVKYKFIGIFLIIILIVMIGLCIPKNSSDQVVNSIIINDTSKSSIVLDLYNNEILYENNAFERAFARADEKMYIQKTEKKAVL